MIIIFFLFFFFWRVNYPFKQLYIILDLYIFWHVQKVQQVITKHSITSCLPTGGNVWRIRLMTLEAQK